MGIFKGKVWSKMILHFLHKFFQETFKSLIFQGHLVEGKNNNKKKTFLNFPLQYNGIPRAFLISECKFFIWPT